MANIEDIMSTIIVVDDNKADDKTASATSATAFPAYPSEKPTKTALNDWIDTWDDETTAVTLR